MDDQYEYVNLVLRLDLIKALRSLIVNRPEEEFKEVSHTLLLAILRAEDKKNEGKKLIKNSAECILCGDVITSKHGHDFKFCKCGKIAVDGGLNYIRRCGEYEHMIDRCEYE